MAPLAVGGGRALHTVLAGVGAFLLLMILFGFSESETPDPNRRLAPSVVARNYVRVLTHPSCLGYLLVSAAAFGSLFAYVSGSSLFLINVVGLRPQQYGLVFAATSLGIMGGSSLSGRLNTLKVAPSYSLMLGLVLATATTMTLLVVTLAGWMPLPVVIPQLVVGNLAFGLIMPNAMERAMQPLPQIAGAAGAAMGFSQMAMGAASSGLVAILYDGHSALSMTSLMVLCSVLALAVYLLVARPAEYAEPL